MEMTKWPKILAPLTSEQQAISDDFMKYWHEQLASQQHYSYFNKFNHSYVIKHAPKNFLRTLEIGAGLGEHLDHENLNYQQQKNYFTLELRENMASKLKEKHPEVTTHVGDCQVTLPFADGYFDRILAIHVLEHLPNLPATIKEMYRLCDRDKGVFSIVIPCEGGFAYSSIRKITAERMFKKLYKQSYTWLIKREHLNTPREILSELKPYFEITHRSFYPLPIPSINLNLFIGLTLRPRK